MKSSTNLVDALGTRGGYFELAARSPVIDRETEYRLAVRYRDTRCPMAAEQLIRSMLRYVISVAAKYARTEAALYDLISDGTLGVMKALPRFDADRGVRLVTFASHWVRAEIAGGLRKSRSVVPSAMISPRLTRRLRQVQRKAVCQFGDTPQAREHMATQLKVDQATLSELLMRQDLQDLSFDAPREAQDVNLHDLIASDLPTPEECLAKSRFKCGLPDEVARAIEGLAPRERMIAEKRLMACPDEQRSLAEIGRELGITRERARQLEVRTKRKLRAHLEHRAPGNNVLAA